MVKKSISLPVAIVGRTSGPIRWTTAGERSLTDFGGRPGTLGTFGLATDGDYLYFTWQNDVGDLWVMDVVDE